MGATPRSDIRTRARIRADQTNSTKPTDTEYNYWIDEACKEVWGDLLQAGWPVDYTEFALTATGAATYTVYNGSSVFSVVGVFYSQGTDVYELQRVNQGDIANLRSQAAQSNRASFYEARYGTSGIVVELYPRPSSGSYIVYYVSEHGGLSSDAASWFGPTRSDELITLRVAAKALHNESMDRDAHFLEQEYERLMSKVQNQASWVDSRNAPHIRNVSGTALRDAFNYTTAGADIG